MDRMLAQFNDNVETISLDSRVKAKVLKKKTNFRVTEVWLEIQKKDEDYTRGAYITIFEDAEGKKRFNVSGEHDLDVWADIMKYVKSV